ncbi:MAG TPA: hypothetical protein VER55_07010 [Ardenticatenaceae bacterium]|nr:hypothetical protein [Ardenticatenaceae bacterium]
MGTELVEVEHDRLTPVFSIEEAVARFDAVVEFVQTVMKPDVDFGVIPGTSKPSLLKPGAEKLCTLFGFTSRFEIVEMIEDWTGESFGGEPLFYYLYRCQLWRGDLLVAQADGSCNSWETKYRYRKADRLCPICGQAAIIKGRPEYGGGWLCFAKKGGCGAKFKDSDQRIESQEVGRVPNRDIADQVNTIQKMAQKRSLVSAVLIAVNASEFFTQDMEDLGFVDGDFREIAASTARPVALGADSFGREAYWTAVRAEGLDEERARAGEQWARELDGTPEVWKTALALLRKKAAKANGAARH